MTLTYILNSSQQDEPVSISYNGKDVLVDRRTGEVLDKAALTFPENALLKFTNVGENGDWKILKVGQLLDLEFGASTCFASTRGGVHPLMLQKRFILKLTARSQQRQLYQHFHELPFQSTVGILVLA